MNMNTDESNDFWPDCGEIETLVVESEPTPEYVDKYIWIVLQ